MLLLPFFKFRKLLDTHHPNSGYGPDKSHPKRWYTCKPLSLNQTSGAGEDTLVPDALSMLSPACLPPAHLGQSLLSFSRVNPVAMISVHLGSVLLLPFCYGAIFFAYSWSPLFLRHDSHGFGGRPSPVFSSPPRFIFPSAINAITLYFTYSLQIVLVL